MHFRYGVVDLRGLPDDLRYGPTITEGEHRRVLDEAQGRQWGFLLGLGAVPAGMVVIGRLEVRNAAT